MVFSCEERLKSSCFFYGMEWDGRQWRNPDIKENWGPASGSIAGDGNLLLNRNTNLAGGSKCSCTSEEKNGHIRSKPFYHIEGKATTSLPQHLFMHMNNEQWLQGKE